MTRPARSTRHKSRSPELGSPKPSKKPALSSVPDVPDKSVGGWRPKTQVFVELPPIKRGVKRTASAASLATSEGSTTKKQAIEARSISVASSGPIDDGHLPIHEEETPATRSTKSSSSPSTSNKSRQSEQRDVIDSVTPTKGKAPVRTSISTVSSRQSSSRGIGNDGFVVDSSPSSARDDSTSDSENEVADLVAASPSAASLQRTTPSKVPSASEDTAEPAAHASVSLAGSSKGSSASLASKATTSPKLKASSLGSKNSTGSSNSKDSTESVTSKLPNVSRGFGQPTSAPKPNENAGPEEEEEEEEEESTQRPLYGKHALLPVLSWRTAPSDGNLGDDGDAGDGAATQVRETVYILPTAF